MGGAELRSVPQAELIGTAWHAVRRGYVTREEFLDLLARLRRASVGNVRAPHKPLLLLWLFGRFAATGSTAAAYAEAEESVSTLINDFGPPFAKPSAGRQRAAMPFVHLEREIWDLRDGSGVEIGPDAPERGRWLAGRGVVGRLRPGAEQLLADPGTLAAAARPPRGCCWTCTSPRAWPP